MDYFKPLLAYWEFVTRIPRNKKSRKAWEGVVLYDICVLGLWSVLLVGLLNRW